MNNIIDFSKIKEIMNSDDHEDKIKDHVIKETSQTFSLKVEDLVWEKDITYFEAVQLLMEKLSYEPEYIAKLLSKDLYTKIAEEVEELSMIKKTNRLDL